METISTETERFRMDTDTRVLAGECNLGPVSQIPMGEGRQFDVGGIQVAVFRLRSGGVYATQALCPHRSGPLADGLTGGTTLACPFHGWKFNLETGAPIQGECGVTMYPVHLSERGEILLQVDKGAEPPPSHGAPASGETNVEGEVSQGGGGEGPTTY